MPYDFDVGGMVEILKIHYDNPSEFIVDEAEFVLIDYFKPLPEIIVPEDSTLNLSESSDSDSDDDDDDDTYIEDFSEFKEEKGEVGQQMDEEL